MTGNVGYSSTVPQFLMTTLVTNGAHPNEKLCRHCRLTYFGENPLSEFVPLVLTLLCDCLK